MTGEIFGPKKFALYSVICCRGRERGRDRERGRGGREGGEGERGGRDKIR